MAAASTKLVSARREFFTLAEEAKAYLRYLKDHGFQGTDVAPEHLGLLETWNRPISAPAAVDTLERLRAEIAGCRGCSLCKTRRHLVFGAGNVNARLVFVGEAPGSDEDLQGEPFVGAAGQLLTRIIRAIGLERGEVYICNILKCRPPENRNPLPEEIEQCLPYLRRQLRIIRPEFVCALGKFAAQTLLETSDSISRLRGSFYEMDGMKVIPTYHPAFLLRNPEKKREVWEDMKLLMKACAR